MEKTGGFSYANRIYGNLFAGIALRHHPADHRRGIFLFALYFVIKKAVKDAIDESGRPKS